MQFIIVHGLEEWVDEIPVERMREDGKFVREKIVKMGIKSKEKLIHCFKTKQIGLITEEKKYRQLKVCFKNKEMKRQVIDNLKILKD